MQTPHHQSRVNASPWQGIFGTQMDSARHYGRHWHATYGLGVLQRGAQRSASGRGHVVAYAGDVIATNPGEVHDGRPLDDAPRRWRMLYLEADVFASWMADSAVQSGCGALVRPVVQDPQLTTALQQLFAQIDRWDAQPGDRRCAALACEEALARTFAGLLPAHTGRAKARQAAASHVSQARARLADDLLNAPTLTELATLAGVSKYQLLRQFEQAYGLPPHAWLLQQRLEQARGLIRSGHRLADAAADSGFADQSHMTRLFVRQFGFTPGAWQKAWRPAISFKTLKA